MILIIIVTALSFIYLILRLEEEKKSKKRCKTALRNFLTEQITGSIFKMTVPEYQYKQRLDEKKSSKRKLKSLNTKSTPSLARKKSVPKKSAK